jgi:GDSL-like Lipase/Acylhydrolase family
MIDRAACATILGAAPMRRRLWFALGAAALGAILALSALLAVDLYAHHRFERRLLYNVWGFRGPTVGRKQPGEYRIAVLGGSAAYGFGVDWSESMASRLGERLAAQPPVTVVDLAYNNQGVYAFVPTLQDYAYLKPDLVVLYESYNDLLGDPSNPTQFVFRHDSGVFRMTGYLPVFPIVAREKASMLLYGDTRALYPLTQHAHTVFTPGLARQTGAKLLQSAAAVGESLERQFDRAASHRPSAIPSEGASVSGCQGEWTAYCALVYRAIRFARTDGVQVLVATPPYVLGERLRTANIAQQREMAEMVARHFANDPDVLYVNFGEQFDLSDPDVSFDRMHLTPDGNARLADALVEPVRALKARRKPR